MSLVGDSDPSKILRKLLGHSWSVNFNLASLSKTSMMIKVGAVLMMLVVSCPSVATQYLFAA